MTGNAAANAGITATTPKTILIIDDDVGMRTILSFTLGAFGYLTLLAANAEEALQIARDHAEIRLIMLDVVMPGLSGNQLAEQLKVNLPGSSILFCSGHPASVMSRYDIDLKSAHFLQKPCPPLELERKIEELLATR
jgi:two-component system cell cycle sensor histidine kinase/response regulator CckA